MKLLDKKILITGGATGIGKASAIEMAKQGAHVAILDINEKGLSETKKQISDLQEKMKRKKNLIKEIGNEIKKLENETANIDIVDGWFLYSNNYVDEISSMIGEFKKQKIFKYSDLSKTLLMPEKILRSVTFFEK